MTHYKSNLRDLEFNLFEVFGLGNLLGTGEFSELDVDTARSILAEVDRLAREDLAASFTESDRHPPTFDPTTHSVKLPESFKKSYHALMDSGFWRLDLPEVLGGTPGPRLLWWSLAELILGSNPAVWMYATGPSFAHTLFLEGTPEQKEWAQLFIDKQWSATMVLTEPDAGSDVGAGRTKAYLQPDGTWHLEGVKRFITSGEHDLVDNIIHYVLARPVGMDGVGGPGTKGLSLFVVPKYHFDSATGEIGERNGAYVTNVEHKMGLKVSTTCELTLGEHEPAKGWLMGEVHDGIRQMFLIIEYARMLVGTKAIATLSTGYLNALDYAKQRVQGADLTNQGPAAPRVTITHHPDVRRSLMLQKSYAEGLRALIAYTAQWQDKARLAPTEEERKLAVRVNDLLLPIVKGCGSERAYELLGHEGLQIFGGSGFLEDYPLEQYIRDSKIDTLYEGTTAIQSLDLVFRKIVKDGGIALGTVAGEIQQYLEDAAVNGQLKDERVALAKAAVDVQGMVGTLGSYLVEVEENPRAVYKIGLHSRRLLLAVGDLFVGWLLQKQAEIALVKLTENPSDAFYQGKVAAARFFAREVLPRLTSDRKIIENAALDVMDLPEEAF
ncbi:MAG: acyl-CoA dehydrogenase [Longispora sp.]|nr:acyl-CoA dehydrogenase [Longispora sp. (in: high G+C Gram-positive bacteria)]